MSLQIKGKFIRLDTGESLKVLSSDGTEVSLIGLDLDDKVTVKGEVVALKADVDAMASQIATATQAVLQSEAAARVLADNALDARLDTAEGHITILRGDATVSGSVAKAEADAKAYTDSRLTDVLGSVNPDIIQTLTSISGALTDSNAATGVLNAIAAEKSAREQADQLLQNELNTTQTGAGLETSGAYVAPSSSFYLSAASSLKDADSKLDTKLHDVDVALSSHVNASSNAHAASAISFVSGSTGLVANDVQAAITELAAVVHNKKSFVLQQSDINAGFITLPHKAMEKSVVASVGRLMIHEAETEAQTDNDFKVTTVNGVSRITFLNSLVTVDQEQLVAGDIVFVKYMHKA